MKCPYNINVKQVYQDTYDYDDNKVSFHQNKLVETHIFTECLKEECMAFKNGECTFNVKNSI